MKSADKRIVITGFGCVTPFGIGKEAFTAGILSTPNCFEYIPFDDVSENKKMVGGTIKGFSAKNYIANRKSLKVMSLDMQIAIASAKMAIEDAKASWDDTTAPGVGVSIGAGMIQSLLSDLANPIVLAYNNGTFDINKFGSESLNVFFPLWLLKQLPNLVASHISIEFNTQGPSNTLTTGSSAGLQAIGEAARTIERGDSVMALCGGSDCRTHPIDLIKYQLLGLYCDTPGEDFLDSYGPYDKKRSGFLTGESAAIFLIERLDNALQRGAHIYAEIAGFGSSAGVTFREKDVDKRAHIESLAVIHALQDAGLQPDDIDCIIGHGCSSVLGDHVEAAAYKKVFGSKLFSMPVTTPSAMTGYVGAATGPQNVACALVALNEQKLPATPFLTDPDPECGLNVVRDTSVPFKADTVLVNTFDFFGQGSAMVLRKFQG
jgi:3-oxoacyl-[acyl-carrier-protein] synthase II